MRKILSLGLAALLLSSCSTKQKSLFFSEITPQKTQENFFISRHDYFQSRERSLKAREIVYHACEKLFSSEYYESIKLFLKAQSSLTRKEKKDLEDVSNLLFLSSFLYSKSVIPEDIGQKSSQILSNLGEDLIDQGRYLEAIDYFKESITLLPEKSPGIKSLKKRIVFSWFKLGDKEKHQEALEDYCSTP
ncbi:hypothetical protein DRN73_02005 [Candidatus Pacearchaeota archaeon]|nr:MAG: hypothetical protein DRN73_02005 [Candidatus Pacearchaeota archaeon]